ncbi:hypothetical protein HDU85_007813 [Gaertneriomyces sp. JEL0708]|nr:hypothetical protein HDU85_007813 [Gaertneriomyces sp. JEL0708]
MDAPGSQSNSPAGTDTEFSDAPQVASYPTSLTSGSLSDAAITATSVNGNSGNKQRKKPGAKPNPFITDMEAYRKEKNRQAQRALRARRALMSTQLQQELQSLRSQVAQLEQANVHYRQQNHQLQQLLALAFSTWMPDVEDLSTKTSTDAVMIAAKALAELSTVARHSPAPPSSASPAATDYFQHKPVSQSQSAFHSPHVPLQIPSVAPSSQPSPFGFGSQSCPPPDMTTPAEVESCAKSMPCFVLKDKIIKFGRQIDLPSLCDELCRRAVCNGNPWDPRDWTVPDDLFERYPGLK